ncbi:MAG: hypothetical protein HY427_01025 [Candidatus Levybacteria bacterium]|nr:hypothetical protein [Candidatus Levybacteria bacterium]
MVSVKLDTVLAFVLIVPFILSHGIWPRATPYWLFALIFTALLILVFLDINKISNRIYEKSKNIIFWGLILSIISGAFISEIILRHESLPIFRIHDIALQQEVAIRYLLIGENPYQEDYFGTPLEQWNYSATEKNPALYHYVMQPFYTLFAIPFSSVSGTLFGFFDGRVPLMFLFFATLVFAHFLIKEGEKKRSFLLLLAFNPAMLPYTIEGRSDFFMLGFLFPSLFFLFRQKLFISAVFMGLAFAVKQSVWPILPFYVAYLWFRKRNSKDFQRTLGIFIGTFAIIVLPFFLWNPKAFIDSTILYLSGNTEHAYPISGYGFGMLLNQFGIIKSIKDNFPFVIFQLLLGIPLIIYLLKYLKKNMSVKNLILVYAIFLSIFWYFSRYFNNSHIAYISILITMVYFWPLDSRSLSRGKPQQDESIHKK